MLVTDLKEKEWILCTTEEECNKILDLMYDAWLIRCNNKTYKENRNMWYLDRWQVYIPYNWKHDSKKYCMDSGYKLYCASNFIWTEKSLNYVYKMWDKVLYNWELCYFIQEGEDWYYIERLIYWWKRDNRISKEYISKLWDKYWWVSDYEITPYEEQEQSEALQDTKEEIFEEKKEDDYPQWVKDLAVEEYEYLEWCKPTNFIKKWTNKWSVYVDFTWSDSRQWLVARSYASIWDYSLLEERIKDNDWEWLNTKAAPVEYRPNFRKESPWISDICIIKHDDGTESLLSDIPIYTSLKNAIVVCEDNVSINTSALNTVSNTTVTDMYANSFKISPIPWIDIVKDMYVSNRPAPNRLWVDPVKVEPTKIKRFRI